MLGCTDYRIIGIYGNEITYAIIINSMDYFNTGTTYNNSRFNYGFSLKHTCIHTIIKRRKCFRDSFGDEYIHVTIVVGRLTSI